MVTYCKLLGYSLGIGPLLLTILSGSHMFLDLGHLLYCLQNQIWDEQLPFANVIPAHRRSALSPIECLIWSHLDTSMIVVVVGDLH